MENDSLSILVRDPALLSQARQLSEQLSLPIREEPAYPLLCVDADGLTLENGGLKIRGDFSRMLKRAAQNNLSGELLVRAAKRKDYPGEALAVDCTAGLGEDSFLLAAAGFQVILFEYNPIVAALLADALERANADPALSPITRRMTLIPGDSRQGLQDLHPDIILLDPMFPARQKSGLVQKKLQLIQLLELPCADETSMLEAALAAHPHKIIIKRPAKGPFLAGVKPGYSLTGKAVRYDCIVPPKG